MKANTVNKRIYTLTWSLSSEPGRIYKPPGLLNQWFDKEFRPGYLTKPSLSFKLPFYDKESFIEWYGADKEITIFDFCDKYVVFYEKGSAWQLANGRTYYLRYKII